MEENTQYWQQLLLNQQIKKENSLINFNLNKDTKKIDKIDLTKLFWKNGARYKELGFHKIQDEMKDYHQCIDERPDFALNNSIMLDEKTKL